MKMTTIEDKIKMILWVIGLIAALLFSVIMFSFASFKNLTKAKYSYVQKQTFEKYKQKDETFKRQVLSDLSDIKGYLRGKNEKD